MQSIVSALLADAPTLLAGVISIVAFFLIARIARARQPVAVAFGFTPILLFWLVEHASSAALTSLS